MPIHQDYHGMLDGMTDQYCDGKTEDTTTGQTAEGYSGKTCQKALSVFYATCKEKGWDYTKPRPKERLTERFQWAMPIEIMDKERMIKGIAIKVGKSRNRINWAQEELQKSARTLAGMPIRINHDPNLGDMGKSSIRFSEFEDDQIEYFGWIDPAARIPFEGKMQDPYDLIKKGVITHGSVGAPPPAWWSDPETPRYFVFDEYSLILPPAEPGAWGTSVEIMEKLLGDPPITVKEAKEKMSLEEKMAEEIRPFIEKILDEKIQRQTIKTSSAFQKEIDSLHEKLTQNESTLKKEIDDLKQKSTETISGFQKEIKETKEALTASIQKGVDEKLGESTKQLQSLQTNIKNLEETLPETIKKNILREVEWTTEYINDLPDSCFAYIESGGEKEEGKTVPRSLRHLPYKDREGNIDREHLAAALQALGGARTGKPLPYADEAKPVLCRAAKEIELESEVCGETEICHIKSDLEAVKTKLNEQLSEEKVRKIIEELLDKHRIEEKFKGEKPPGEGVIEPKEEEPIFKIPFSQKRLADVVQSQSQT